VPLGRSPPLPQRVLRIRCHRAASEPKLVHDEVIAATSPRDSISIQNPGDELISWINNTPSRISTEHVHDEESSPRSRLRLDPSVGDEFVVEHHILLLDLDVVDSTMKQHCNRCIGCIETECSDHCNYIVHVYFVYFYLLVAMVNIIHFQKLSCLVLQACKRCIGMMYWKGYN
jgi:hypothetical protein